MLVKTILLRQDKDRFEQSEADPCVSCKFDYGEVGMVLVVHVDDNLAHAKDQATMERFAAELEANFEVKSMVEKFGVEKASRTPAYSRVPALSKRTSRKLQRRKGDMLKFPYREAIGALMWTETTIRPDIACAVRAVARFWKPWAGP